VAPGASDYRDRDLQTTHRSLGADERRKYCSLVHNAKQRQRASIKSRITNVARLRPHEIKPLVISQQSSRSPCATIASGLDGAASGPLIGLGAGSVHVARNRHKTSESRPDFPGDRRRLFSRDYRQSGKSSLTPVREALNVEELVCCCKSVPERVGLPGSPAHSRRNPKTRRF
jgi:hypothetical protein